MFVQWIPFFIRKKICIICDKLRIYLEQISSATAFCYFCYSVIILLLFISYIHIRNIYIIYIISVIDIYIYVYIILLLYMLLFFYIWSSRSVYFDLVFLGIWYSYYASHNIFASRCNIAWHVNTWEKSKFESFLYFWFYGNLLGFHDLLNLIFMKCLHP